MTTTTSYTGEIKALNSRIEELTAEMANATLRNKTSFARALGNKIADLTARRDAVELELYEKYGYQVR